jgi:hypothetical protein
MSTVNPNDPLRGDPRLDGAVERRLARLRTMPVDTSRLEKAILSQIPRPQLEEPAEQQQQRQRMRIGWLTAMRPLRAVAASFLLLSAVVAAVLLFSSGGQALASPSQMAQMHEDLVSGRTPVMQVTSIEEANKVLSGEWPGGPSVPGAPQSHVMACCMKSIKDKKVACVLLRSEGEPVTMTVANAADMRLPKSATITHAGVTYHVQSSGPLNMVMTERNGRWVCLIGRLPGERLMNLASRLTF